MAQGQGTYSPSIVGLTRDLATPIISLDPALPHFAYVSHDMRVTTRLPPTLLLSPHYLKTHKPPMLLLLLLLRPLLYHNCSS